MPSVISKLAGSSREEIAKRLPKDKGAALLLSISTIFSSTSAIILLKLYSKSLKLRTEAKDGKQSSRGEGRKTKKQNLNKKFLAQIGPLLRIIIPKWNSPEVGYMTLISSMLIVRSLCDLWTIYLGTLIESSIISGEISGFLKHLKKFAMTMPIMSLTNSLLKYSTRQLEIRFRARLTEHLMRKYMFKLTFYKLNQRVQNVDQVLTTDVEKFAQTVASLYSQLSKPMLDILIYVYGISRSIGASVPFTMLGYLAISAVIISILRRPQARLTMAEQVLEGEYRFQNSRIITNSEEIGFYKGGSRELDWILKSFSNLYNHLDGFIAFKFVTEFFENFVAKYVGTVVGYYAVGRPFFSSEGKTFSHAEFKDRQETYYRSGRMLVHLAQAIGRLVLNGKEVSRLAGYTMRVHELNESLTSLNKEEDNSSSSSSKSSRQQWNTKQNQQGEFIIKDNVIRFEDVPIITPNGDVLIQKLSFEVKSGMNVLISGPNGCGKSSLFRILGELWPLHGGTVTKPEISKLFYVPQKPYMPHGSFRDQIIYPDTVTEMRSKGVQDTNLVEFLRLVDLDGMVQVEEVNKQKDTLLESVWRQCEDEQNPEKVSTSPNEEVKTLGQKWTWDSTANWMDVLSGGQKQRLAMARMFYHRPQFAILDECTSAVSVDVEGTIYKYCRSQGITLFTVTHRKSLWDYHDYVLHMDGRGSYSMKPIDHAKAPEFGS